MSFLDNNFLLRTEAAKRLYFDYAQSLPIVDYHCHIDPKDIYEDKRYENITELWLGADHYKWRLMRSNGVQERYITGDAKDYDKFEKFAQTLPLAIGNPLYHWCHLELKNYFGFDGVLNADTAKEVWELTKEKLANDKSLSARGLIEKSGVIFIGTTDDPCSDLHWHRLLKNEGFSAEVCPSFRPDPALAIDKPNFAEYIKKLSDSAGINIESMEALKAALSARMDFFDTLGCRAADHGLDYVPFEVLPDAELEKIFNAGIFGDTLTVKQMDAFKTALLLHCAKEYAKRGWVMQLHFSCMRNPNTRRYRELGADSGFDSMAVTDSCAALYRLMDTLDSEYSLPKTVIYSLNPADDQWIDTLIGAFQSDELPGKLQHGSAWWFNDHKSGMTAQLTSLANLGVLGNFIGMLTDSRSFLSYARHEYFRRILCALLGDLIENGEYPFDVEYVGKLVEDICLNNARRYFRV